MNGLPSCSCKVLQQRMREHFSQFGLKKIKIKAKDADITLQTDFLLTYTEREYTNSREKINDLVISLGFTSIPDKTEKKNSRGYNLHYFPLSAAGLTFSFSFKELNYLKRLICTYHLHTDIKNKIVTKGTCPCVQICHHILWSHKRVTYCEHPIS